MVHKYTKIEKNLGGTQEERKRKKLYKRHQVSCFAGFLDVVLIALFRLPAFLGMLNVVSEIRYTLYKIISS